MPDQELSARQQALCKIWDSQGVPDLLQLMVEMRAARDPSLTQELRDEASQCEMVNPILANRLCQISETLEQIHKLVHAFALVKDMRGFVACHHRSDLCWTPEFPRVIGGFMKDALHAQDSSLLSGLRTGLRVRTRAIRAVRCFQQIARAVPETLNELFDREPLLCDPLFHQWLGLRADIAARMGDTSSIAVRTMLEHLLRRCRLRGVLHDLSTWEKLNSYRISAQPRR